MSVSVKKRMGTSFIAVVSALCLYIACESAVHHTVAITTAREVALPTLASITSLEQEESLLRDQVEIAELQSELRSSLPEEQLAAYVVPLEIDIDRFIALFEVFIDYYSQKGFIDPDASFSLMAASATEPAQISFKATMHSVALEQLLMLQELSGVITVYDALTEEQRTALIQRVERENPTAITELESFFSELLPEYARNTQAVQDRLLRSFTNSQFLDFFTAIITDSSLNTAELFLTTSYGKHLHKHDLWPIPFLTMSATTIKKGSVTDWQTVDLTFTIN